tara:strand:- start:102 stop:323 length:222 start_codon:yes stop_codon:yes gene_type:complete
MNTGYLSRIFYNSIKTARNNGRVSQVLYPSVYSNQYSGDEVVVAANNAYIKYKNEINENKSKEIKPAKTSIIT